MNLTEIWHANVEDHVLALVWSGDSQYLAAIPTADRIVVHAREGNPVAVLPGDPAGNGIPSWNGQILATCGLSGRVRLHSLASPQEDPRIFSPARGIITKTAWSPDKEFLAFSQGPGLHLIGTDGTIPHTFPAKGVSDFVWNPGARSEIATAVAGGASMWRVGENEPFSRFEWGGASVAVTWSPNARWLATADQTPSIHLYDFSRNEPLHIQGYPTKVRCLDFSANSERLATACGETLTIWNCTGERGPEGSTPHQPDLHTAEIFALAFHPNRNLLASADESGRLVLSTNGIPVAALDADHPLSALSWSPDGSLLAAGDSEGFFYMLKVA